MYGNANGKAPTALRAAPAAQAGRATRSANLYSRAVRTCGVHGLHIPSPVERLHITLAAHAHGTRHRAPLDLLQRATLVLRAIGPCRTPHLVLDADGEVTARSITRANP